MDKRGNLKNGPKDKKVDDYAQGLTFKKWHRQMIEGGSRHTSIEDSMDATIQGLKDYIKKSKERLITTASTSNTNIKTNRTTTRKQKWKEK